MVEKKKPDSLFMSRRDFLLASAATGAGLMLSSSGLAQEPSPAPGKNDDLHIALIGAGAQGRVLLESIVRIPGIRVQAICDIWDYSLKYGVNFVKKLGHNPTGYEDYQEMLDKEKGLDAAVIATPDFMHAEHTNACLRAGLHVYCEKEMSNSLESARSMVLTARETKKLLQIGHQRRSNPRYIHAIERLVKERKIFGRITHANAQWNRSKSDDLGWPKRNTIPQETLERYGYASMQHFRNWRWYRKYGGGPIVDLGSHQIDIFSWVFRTNPRSVVACGGVDFYRDHEWFDNVMCIYEYENDEGVGRAFYQVLTTTKHGGFYETFMGENGSLQISEVPARGNSCMRENHAPDWGALAMEGLLLKETAPITRAPIKDVAVDVRVTADTGKWPLPVELNKPAHQPHLENFFDAIRYGKPLNCPGEVGYETAVAVIKVNEAVATGQPVYFKPEDFHV